MKKSGDRKFVQRVLTAEEQKAVLNSSTPDKLLQVYWAAKEAAYKATAKTYPDVSSAPRRYEVLLLTSENGSNVRGRVETPRAVVHITAQHHLDFIHCFGTTPFPIQSDIVYGVEKVTGRAQTDFCRSSETASHRVRALAKKKIAAMLSIDTENIAITKTDDRKGLFAPAVYIDMKKTDIDISLSHDGRFVAYALLFN